MIRRWCLLRSRLVPLRAATLNAVFGVLCLVSTAALGGETSVEPRQGQPLSEADRKQQLAERDRLWKEAGELRTAGKPDEAVKRLTDAIQVQKALFGANSIGEAEEYDLIAQIERARERWTEALVAARAAQAVWTKRQGAVDWHTIDARLLVADLETWSKLSPEQRTQLAQATASETEAGKLLAAGKSQEAVSAAEKSLTPRLAILGQRHRLTADAYAVQARAYNGIRDYPKAKAANEKALEIRGQVLGTTHPDYAISLNNLAFDLQQTGEQTKAADTYRQAVLVYTKAKGSADASSRTMRQNLLDLLDKLAVDHQQHERFAEARQCRAEILSVGQQLWGAEHWKTIDAHLALADVDRWAKFSPEQRQQLDKTIADLAQAQKLSESGKHAEAIALTEAALMVRSTILGEQHYLTANSYGVANVVYAAAGQYAQAKPASQRALDIRERVLGTKHPTYALSLANLAAVNEQLNKLPEAEQLYSRAIEVAKQALGENDNDVASYFTGLARVCHRRGEDQRAETLLRQALAIRQRNSGERSPKYAEALRRLASLLDDMGDQVQAERLGRQALQIDQAAYGEEHLVCATDLSVLAAIYCDMFDYRQSEAFAIRSLAIIKKLRGENDAGYATMLNKLAEMYRISGQNAKAEPLYQQVLSIRKQLFGEKHPDYAVGLHNLGSFYHQIGDYDRAATLLLQALEIWKVTPGEKSLEYANCLNSLGTLFDDWEKTEVAAKLLEKSLAVKRELFGESNKDYALTLVNLGWVYRKRGDLARAENACRHSMEIWKGLVGERDPNYAQSLHDLAWVQLERGEYAQAESLFVQALAIWKQTVGEQHADFATCSIDLALLYTYMGEYDRAEPLYRQTLEITRAWLEEASLAQSERQQVLMGQKMRYQLNRFVSFGVISKRFAREIYEQVLDWKGATWVRQRGMRLAARDPIVKAGFERLRQVATQLTTLSRATPAKEEQWLSWRSELDGLVRQKEQLEAQISAQSAAFRQAKKEVTLAELLGSLPDGAALVDFLEFKHMSPPSTKGGKRTSQSQLVAFVIRRADTPDGQVTMLDLGAVEPITAAVDAWRVTYGGGATAEAAGRLLREKVWEPLLPAIGDARTLLVSTDGALGRFPIGALPGKEPGKYLLEEYRLAMIPVPQLLPALLDDSNSKTLAKDLLLLGNVDYDAAGVDTKVASTGSNDDLFRGATHVAARTGSEQFGPLPATRAEIATIDDILHGVTAKLHRSAPAVEQLSQDNATVAHFRELAPQCRYLHLATHGFFAAPTPDSNDAGRSPQPIVGIGVALESKDRAVIVSKIVPGGAAAIDGRLHAGDTIRRLAEGQGPFLELDGKPLAEAAKLIRGEAESTVQLEVIPVGKTEPAVYRLTRKPVPQEAQTATSNSRALAASRAAKILGSAPSLLSGLAFSGANRPPAPDHDDGILTAEEIACMPLDGVRLVTLSACETGLGATAGGEGLLGLQRAFQVSGARTTIASYWKVADEATRMLMIRFYTNLWEKRMSKLDALREAQLYLLDHPESVRGLDLEQEGKLQQEEKAERTSPRFWAAFSLAGDWR